VKTTNARSVPTPAGESLIAVSPITGPMHKHSICSKVRIQAPFLFKIERSTFFFEKNGRTSAFHYGRVTVNKTKRNLQTANAVHSTAMEVQQSSSTTKQTEKDKRR
jgi:hypothetical protein